MATKKKMLQAAAGNAGGAALNVEDLFSTYLYDGNGDGSAATNVQTINNGIDLSGEGGMVWIKGRSHTTDHIINDTVRGAGNTLQPNLSDANQTGYYDISQFNSNGFGLDAGGNVNANGYDYASWTFRKAPKFFDVVTYTGDGTSGRSISHNLGCDVGFIAIKILNSSDNWECFHRGVTFNSGNVLWLNSTNAVTTGASRFPTAPDSTNFYLGSDSGVNGNGNTYVAYLFAHNDGDGEFGPDGDQDIIKCGSYTGTGSAGLEVDLGFEPQWLLVKSATRGGQHWELVDTMRGFTSGSVDERLRPAASATGESTFNVFEPTATGFKTGTSVLDETNESGQTYIYIAIRRGTKVPESATEVFDVQTKTASRSFVTTNFVTDLYLQRRPSESIDWYSIDRMTGGAKYLSPNTTAAQVNITDSYYQSDLGHNNGYDNKLFGGGGSASCFWSWKRAPGFFDVVAYTGNYTDGRTVTHNLGVAPEMIWVKLRDTYSTEWMVFHKDLATNHNLQLDSTAASQDYSGRIRTPTATTFTLGNDTSVNRQSPLQYISYLFASLPGISKVGSYTGTGSTQQTIDCGFSNSARFVLIKRSSGTSQWYVFDTERGITSTANDGVLYLNLTNAEQPESSAIGIDAIQPDSSGFKVQYGDLNSSGATFIFYAIA